MRARPIRQVPVWIIVLLGCALAAQVFVAQRRPPPRAGAADLPQPASLATLRLASFGEPAAAGKLLMLWLQAFDFQSGSKVPYRNLDYARLEEWLARILALDPLGQYPLMSASRIYAEVQDASKQRRMLDLIYREYLLDPNRRWPWLAHAAIIAKHQLKDLPLARHYAVTLQRNTTAADAPLWVKSMELFVLEDMNELEAAQVLIGGLLAGGQIKDERERALLERRLDQLQERLRRNNPTAPRHESVE